jgi:hypothetical protein
MTEIRRFTSDAQLDNWCWYHSPSTPEVVMAHEDVRAMARQFMKLIQVVVPECPDKTVAFRAVREAMFAANAAIACNQPDES